MAKLFFGRPLPGRGSAPCTRGEPFKPARHFNDNALQLSQGLHLESSASSRRRMGLFEFLDSDFGDAVAFHFFHRVSVSIVLEAVADFGDPL